MYKTPDGPQYMLMQHVLRDKQTTPKLPFTPPHIDIKGENIKSFHLDISSDHLYAIREYLLVQQPHKLVVYHYKIEMDTAANEKSRIVLTRVKTVSNHVLIYLVTRVNRKALHLLFNIFLTLIARNTKDINSEMDRIVLSLNVPDIVDVDMGESVEVLDKYGDTTEYVNDLDTENDSNKKSGSKTKESKEPDENKDIDNPYDIAPVPSLGRTVSISNDDFVLEANNGRLRMNYFKRRFIENLTLTNVIDFICVDNVVFVLLKMGVEVLVFT